MVKFTFLIENRTVSDDIMCEHGLSVFIETQEMNILFDAGSTDRFLENAAKLGVDLGSADAAVISHGHYDHTGGIPCFCSLNSKAPVYIHRNAFGDFHGSEKGVIRERPCGIRWTDEEYDSVKDRICWTDGKTYLTENIVISGSVPEKDSDMPEKFFRLEEDGTAIEDDMSHEQFLVIRDEKLGLFVFSGCSHRGIIPALRYAMEIFPDEKIFAVIAGMHLLHSDSEKIKKVTQEIMAFDPKVTAPVHCTGEEAIDYMREAFGDRYIRGTAGESYEYK